MKLTLPRRAAQAVPPRTALVDLRVNAVEGGISTPAIQAIERHLKDDGQVLVFLNRRGYAPTVAMYRLRLGPHRAPTAMLGSRSIARPIAFVVTTAEPISRCPHRCLQCGFAVKPVGQGTERIEETLAKVFPNVALARLDRDVVRKRGDMEEAMARMHSGERAFWSAHRW